MASCRIQASKKKARGSINSMFMGCTKETFMDLWDKIRGVDSQTWMGCLLKQQ